MCAHHTLFCSVLAVKPKTSYMFMGPGVPVSKTPIKVSASAMTCSSELIATLAPNSDFPLIVGFTKAFQAAM